MPYSQRAEGLDEFQQELRLLPDEILDQGERIVGKGMNNVKKGSADRVRRDRPAHLPHLARSYSYDVRRQGNVIRGEAGADMEKPQGRLDIYYQSGTATSAPHPTWSLAFDEELPKFEKYAEEYLAKLVGG